MDNRSTAAAALALAVLCGPAAGEELPQRAPCQAALRALDDAEDALGAAWAASAASAGQAGAVPDAQRQRRIAAQLYPLRQRVADACLGGVPAAPARRGGAAWPPAAAALPGVAPMPRRPVAPVPAPAPVVMPRVQGPLTLGHCDAATCVTSDGATLTRVGPHLVGPRGLCTVQGAVVNCP